ncbi:hypothetical protein AAEP93_009750 [Penicillium crustosum]
MAVPATDVISIAELMSHHRGLLVQPICWTSRHLEMLRCRFEHLDHMPTDDTEPISDACQPIPIDHGKTLAKWREPTYEEIFASGRHFMRRESCLQYLLPPLLDRKCETPYFFFANKRIHRPQYSVFYRGRKHSQPAGQAPRLTLGYLDYLDVERCRQEMFPARFPTEDITNRLRVRIQRKRVAQITPKNWSENPYLLCALLALAQLQEHHRTELHPPIHLSRLLLTYKPDDKFFHEFEAHITSELLELLDNPSTATKCIDWLTINHKRVPFHPVEGLKERIQIESALNQPPGTFEISDPVDPVIPREGMRQYQDQVDEIYIQR